MNSGAPEGWATRGTQCEENKNKETTQYVLNTRKQRQIRNKTRAIIQTTRGKDEANIVFCGNRNGRRRTQNVKTHTRTTQKTGKKMKSITFTTKKS